MASERTPLKGQFRSYLRNPGEDHDRNDTIHGHITERQVTEDTERGAGSTAEAITLTPGQVARIALPLGLGIVLNIADSSVELASYFQIGDTFNQLRHVSWLTNAYVTTVLVSQPLYSRMSDIYGRKALVIASYTLFGLGILLCSISTTFWGLCISRAIVGFGSAGMGYMVILILNDVVPLRQRGLWDSGIQASVLIGTVLGGVIGSMLVENIGWRTAFLCELPVVPILLIWVAKGVRLPKLKVSLYQGSTGINLKGHIKRGTFDLMGTGTLILLLAALALALNMGGNDLPWGHPAVISLFAVAATMLWVFVWVELNVAKMPLVPVKVLVTREVLPIMMSGFFGVAFLISLTYTIPYYINVSGKGGTGLGGLMNTFLTVGRNCGTVVSGYTILRYGRPKGVLVIAPILGLLSSFWMVSRWSCKSSSFHKWANMMITTKTEPDGERLWENIVPHIISGIAIGAMHNANVVCLWKATLLDQRAIMYGVYHIFVETSKMISISGISAIIQNQFGRHLSRNLGQTTNIDIDAAAQSCMESLECLDAYAPEVRDQIRLSFSQATHDSFFLSFAFAACMLISGCLTRSYKIMPADT